MTQKRELHEFKELLRRCAYTIYHLQSMGIAQGDALLFAGALHHSRAAEKVASLWEPPFRKRHPVVDELLKLRLALAKTMPARTNDERDALMERAVDRISKRG